MDHVFCRHILQACVQSMSLTLTDLHGRVYVKYRSGFDTDDEHIFQEAACLRKLD